jgi:hypothetical protein
MKDSRWFSSEVVGTFGSLRLCLLGGEGGNWFASGIGACACGSDSMRR